MSVIKFFFLPSLNKKTFRTFVPLSPPPLGSRVERIVGLPDVHFLFWFLPTLEDGLVNDILFPPSFWDEFPKETK